MVFRPDGQWELNDENIKRIVPQTGENINEPRVEVFEYLIGRGADVNIQHSLKCTPLHVALNHFALESNIELIKYLFNLPGINFSFKDRHGCTLLQSACLNSRRVPTYLFKHLLETNHSKLENDFLFCNARIT